MLNVLFDFKINKGFLKNNYNVCLYVIWLNYLIFNNGIYEFFFIILFVLK